MKPKSRIAKHQTVSIKADYSHITSRVFESNSKSKQKYSNKVIDKTVRMSIEKIEEIGEEKYKQAMRHVNKFKKYEKQIEQRKKLEQQAIDEECTFKPKINLTKKYSNQSSKYMSTSYLNRFNNNNGKTNPEKNPKKDHEIIKIEQIAPKTVKKPTHLQLAQRLLNWSKQRDMKNLNRSIEMQVKRSFSKQSMISFKSEKKQSLPKQLTYGKRNKLKLALSTILHPQISHNSIKHSMIQSPRTQRLGLHKTGRSTISLVGSNQNQALAQDHLYDGQLDFSIEENEFQQKSTMLKKGRRLYTEITPSMETFESIGQKIVASQNNRGEESFYLRHARANVMKNYQKTDLVVKNKQYSKNFSNLLLKNNERKNQFIQFT